MRSCSTSAVPLRVWHVQFGTRIQLCVAFPVSFFCMQFYFSTNFWEVLVSGTITVHTSSRQIHVNGKTGRMLSL